MSEALRDNLDAQVFDTTQDSELVKAKTLLTIVDLGSRSRAIGLSLRPKDVIVAVDGVHFEGNADDLIQRLQQPEVDSEFIDEDEEKEIVEFLLTVYRAGVFFEVITTGPLGGKLDFEAPESVEAILQAFQGRKVYPVKDYTKFEVYRDFNRKCLVISHETSPIAGILPLVWLAEFRMWEAFLAIAAVYGLMFGIHPVVFVISYVLTCVYFGRGQLVFHRSYAQFQEKQFWQFLAARSLLDAQMKCRELDEQCVFEFSLVPPPRKRRVQPVEA